MIWISNFNHFSLLENYGTPDFAKKLSTEILSDLFKNKFKSYTKILNIEDIIEIKSIDIIINNINKDFSSKFISDKNNLFNDIILEFDIPDIESNWNYFHEIILHELTHLYEFYNIIKNNRDLPIYSKIKGGLVNTISQDNIDPFNYFRNLVYLTLDNELNARVSQTFNYLKQTGLKDPKLLSSAVKNSSTWKKMDIIKNFNPKKYANDLVDTLGIDFSCLLVNIFNDELKSNGLNFNITNTSDSEDLIKYFNYWNRKFKYKMRKHEDKLNKIVNGIY